MNAAVTNSDAATLVAAKPRILIADDERANRRLLEALLEPEGYALHSVEDGTAALHALAEAPFDLVLLDVMMPRLDGVQACRAIREDLKQPLLPVVLVTALNDTASRVRGKDAGADDFLTKPVHEGELLARVRALLRAKAVHEALEEQRRMLAYESRRWRLVSRVSEVVGAARSLGEIGERLVSALGDELPISRPRFVFAPRELPALAPDAGSVIVPLSAGGAPAGALLVDWRDGEAPTAQDEELLAMLAPHISNAVAQAHLAAARAELDRAREALAAHLLHDLKNPLTIMNLNIDIARAALADAPASADLAGSLAAAALAGEQLQHMMLDLLDISRAEDGGLPFRPAQVDLGAVVDEATQRFRPIVERAGADLLVSIDEAVPSPMTIDALLLSRLLANLLTNGARFVPRGGHVEVSLGAAGDEVLLTVGNDGPRIPADVRASIFERYGQTTVDQGSMNRGLGLYLCRLVAERHGGSIAAHDRDGGGVRFEVRLPIRRGDP